MEAAGIAPACRNPQANMQQDSCVDAVPSCLHPAGNELALRELVTARHEVSAECPGNDCENRAQPVRLLACWRLGADGVRYHVREGA